LWHQINIEAVNLEPENWVNLMKRGRLFLIATVSLALPLAYQLASFIPSNGFLVQQVVGRANMAQGTVGLFALAAEGQGGNPMSGQVVQVLASGFGI
jgi:hypothetical protein